MIMLNCFFATLCSRLGLGGRKAKPTTPESVKYNTAIPAGYDVVAFRAPKLGEIFRG